MKKFLTHPLTIVIACFFGMMTGLYQPDLTIAIKPVGEVYLSVLNMCVLPIIICAIISSVGSLFKSSENHNVRKMLLLFLAFISLSCATGLVCSLGVFKTFGIGDDLNKTVGSLMVNNDSQESHNATGNGFQSVIYDITTETPQVVGEESGVTTFVKGLITENIFEALASKRLLKILTFFLLFSIMLKYVEEKERELIIAFSDAVFSVMQKLIDVIICFLPLGLWALLANQFRDIDVQFLMALGSFVLMIWVSSFFILAMSAVLFWRATSISPLKQMVVLKAPIFIALSTRSSFPTLPAALTALEDIGLDKASTNLSVSLGHTLCKYGKSMVFCVGAVYSFYLYDIPVTFFSLVSIFILSILAGMAASGAPSIISRTMIALVLSPLGVPSEAIIIILLTVDPVTDPVITLVSTYPNYAVAAMLSEKSAVETQTFIGEPETISSMT